MNGKNRQHDSIDRRKFLRSAGVAAAGLASVQTAAAAKPEPDTETYLELSERRERADWDVHQWRRQLAVYGFDFKYEDRKISTSDGPSTEKLDKPETEFHVTYTSGSPDWVNFEWSLNDGWDDSGASPRDYASIAFNDNHYDRTSYGPQYGSYVSPIGERTDDTASNGVVVEYNEDHHAGVTSGRFGSWFEIAVTPESGTSSYSRTVKVDYWHTWNSTSGSAVSDINIQSDGDVLLSLSRGNNWQRQLSVEEWQMDNGDTYIG